MPAKQNKPISQKEEVTENPDHKIDQDFPGYPHGTAKEETINPKTKQEKKVAGTDMKDGEKINIQPGERKGIDEQEADGSPNAFENK